MLHTIAALYGSSDSEENEGQESCPQPCDSGKPAIDAFPHPAKLPLPNFLSAVLPESSNQRDSLGKKRQIPHTPGNWATIVSIPIELGFQMADIFRLIEAITLNSDTFHPLQEFHISLSKTLYLKYHQFDFFFESLKSLFSPVANFFITFDGIESFSNEDQSRYFLAASVSSGNHILASYTKLVDSIALQYGLPIYYENPK
eukprot:Sdes_comp15159_c0_seq1m3977